MHRGVLWLSIFSLTAGAYQVSAHAVAPPANDDIAQAVAVDVNSSLNEDTRLATTVADDPKHSCTGSPDANTTWFSFLAPADGTLTVDTFGSDYDTVLSVYAGAAAGLAERACNDDFAGSQSQLSLAVVQNESLSIEVSGHGAMPGGRLTLDVYFEPRTACSTIPIPAAGGFFDGGTSGNSLLTGNGDCDATDIAPEQVFEWTPDRSGTASIDTCSAETDFDTVLYLRTFGCRTGAQVACGDDDCPNATGENYASRITPTVIAGQTYYIVVDGFGPETGDFRLTVAPPPCPALIDLGSPPTVSTGGTTVGAENVLLGTCGGGSAPERAFRYTAPIGGVYTIDTVSSQLDTVLYVRDGDLCDGAELGCNDDGGAAASAALTVNLNAGQSISIVVDGAGAASGNFVLHVNHTQLATPTRTASRTPTPTVPTATATRTATNAPTPTVTAIGLATRSRTPTRTSTAGATATGPSTPPPVSTATPSQTPGARTPTGAATLTPTGGLATATRTSVATTTQTSGANASPTATPGATPPGTPPPSVTASPTPTATGALLPTPSATATVAAGSGCSGDCTADDEVTVDEIIAMVNIALGNAPLAMCPAGDSSGDGEITVDEILAAVNKALAGC